MIITLQPDEVQVCQMVGRMRSLIARGNGVRDAKMGNQDGAEADVMGMMAEYGFAKKMNVFPDLGLVARWSGSADGVMAIITLQDEVQAQVGHAIAGNSDAQRSEAWA